MLCFNRWMSMALTAFMLDFASIFLEMAVVNEH